MSVPQNKAGFQAIFNMGSKRVLRKVAKENGIKNYSKLNKEQLVAKLIAEMPEVRKREEARINKQKALTEVAKKLQTKYPNAKVFYKRNVLNFTTIGPPVGGAGSINRKTYNDANDVEANIAQSYGQFIQAVMNDGEDILTGKAVAMDNRKKLEKAFKAFKAMRANALGKREAMNKATTFAETKAKQKALGAIRKEATERKEERKSKYMFDDIPLAEKELDGTTWLVDEITGEIYGATHLKPPVKNKIIGKLSLKKQFKSWLAKPPTIDFFNNPPQSIIDYYDEEDDE
jgi:hypothetical protein